MDGKRFYAGNRITGRTMGSVSYVSTYLVNPSLWGSPTALDYAAQHRVQLAMQFMMPTSEPDCWSLYTTGGLMVHSTT